MNGLLEIPTICCIAFVRLYQITLRPFIGGHCRFHPTCSAYAIEAIQKYGAVKGTAKSIWRILRCHPWGGCGEDYP